MTIRSLISECNYKYFFNAIYKYYLKDNTHDFVRGFDALLFNYFKLTRNNKPIQDPDENFQLYLSNPSDQIIDVSILDLALDELQPTDKFKLDQVLNFEIITSVQLNKQEILAHCIWAFKSELV